MMTDTTAKTFAAEWIAAWNAHDLERVLGHYSDDVVVTSAFVERITGDTAGAVRGKTALRAYWARALERFPDLMFSLLDAFPGVGSVVLRYRSVNSLVCAEFMRFDRDGLVCEVVAHYLPGTNS